MANPISRQKKVAGERLWKLCYNRYHESIPLTEIDNILRDNGLKLVQEDGSDWSGFLCGEDGSCTIDLATAGTNIPVKNFMLVLQWHKMPSGRYEVNTYLS